jgi:hypothetical protein
MWWKTVCFSEDFRLQLILQWSCHSGMVIELYFTPMELRKRRTPQEWNFGTDCLKQFLAAEQSTSADHFSGQLLEELSRWSARGSADLDDDITMVAIHAKK